jgi:hypothetical protein
MRLARPVLAWPRSPVYAPMAGPPYREAQGYRRTGGLTELISIYGYEANREALHAGQHTFQDQRSATKQSLRGLHYIT